jgi:hypothetical protein
VKEEVSSTYRVYINSAVTPFAYLTDLTPFSNFLFATVPFTSVPLGRTEGLFSDLTSPETKNCGL